MSSSPSIAILIASSLLSGLLGVLISSYYYQRFERRQQKRDVLRRIAGARMFITTTMLDENNRDFFVALNEVAVVFADSPKVVAALRKMHEELRQPGRQNDNIVSLIKEMAKAAGIRWPQLNDNFIESPFAPNKHMSQRTEC